MYFSILECLLFCLCIYNVRCQSPEVEIPQGRLSGATRTNVDGGTYYIFQSIPFAQPPVGDLRFKAPQPADPWEGTRDATQDIPSCIQSGYASGQEDCLYLNIYTPGLPAENITRLPVMVWIYGGAFVRGSASEGRYGGQFLLTKDVILVLPNYRVGIFGFLSLDDPNLGVTGNAGLKDQILALQWVQDNIEYFGGDPNNVLLFGQSAGGMSVQLLLLSPMADGLFHRAISHSGDSTTGLIDPVTRNNGEFLASALGIQTDDWEAMLETLQEYPADVLSITDAEFNPTYSLFSGPIIEIPSNVGPTFLQEKPIDIIRSGTYNHVPFITGHTNAEGLMFQLMQRQSTGQSILLEDFTDFVPAEFNVQGTNLEYLLSFVIRNFYYGETQPSRDNITGAIQLTTDYGFAFPAYRTASEYVRTSENPVYFYYFDSVTALNYRKFSDETVAEYPGATHGDDLSYLFYTLETESVTMGDLEERGFRNMVNLWTNFAIYGNPTPDNSSGFIWQPVERDQFNYLHISTEESVPVLNSVPERYRLDFWWDLYSQFAG